MTDYAAVLNAIRPGAEWSLNDNDYATLAWYSEGEPPTQAELDAAAPQVEYDRAYAQVERATRCLHYGCGPAVFQVAAWDGYGAGVA